MRTQLGIRESLFYATFIIVLVVLTMMVVFGQEREDNKVLMVCFKSQQCRYCPQMIPIWNKMKAAGVDVFVVDTADQRAMSERWKVTGVPATFVCYTTPADPKNPVVHTKVEGVTTAEKLYRYLHEAKESK